MSNKKIKIVNLRIFDKLPEEKKIVPPIEVNNEPKITKEHPELKKLYNELNKFLVNKYSRRGRCRELDRFDEIEEASLRKKIKDYCNEHSITREDYLRWNT